MKKNVLKIGVIVAVVMVAVWNVGMNETKVLFTSFFELEAMAKLESICKSNGSHDTGHCTQSVNPSDGSFCARADWFDSKNCYGTGQDNF
ncbi:hypothetical protein [uncultured Parabacteroides sp.]|uniref:hypothetical protein n=1 Tax=uncultured Parabacteroides sp. TaxID=512312 RepID=UPI002659F0AD|nr:hypothetical protein [uncultured Parabacteroides sp.]